jgi:rRNA-processing protein FCF1
VIILLSLSNVKAHDEFTTDELKSIATSLSNYDLCTNDRNLLERKVDDKETEIWYYRIGTVAVIILAIIF